MTEFNNFIKYIDHYQGFCAVITLIIAFPSIIATVWKKISNNMKYGKYKSPTEDILDFCIYIIMSSIVIPLFSIIVAFTLIFLFFLITSNLLHVINYNNIFINYLLHILIIIINFLIMRLLLNSSKVRKHLLIAKDKIKLYRIFIGIFLMLFSISITFIGLLGTIGEILGNIIMSIQLFSIIIILCVIPDCYYIIKEQMSSIYLHNGEIIKIKTEQLNITKDFIQINELDTTTTIGRCNIAKIVDTYNISFQASKKTKYKSKRLGSRFSLIRKRHNNNLQDSYLKLLHEAQEKNIDPSDIRLALNFIQQTRDKK